MLLIYFIHMQVCKLITDIQLPILEVGISLTESIHANEMNHRCTLEESSHLHHIHGDLTKSYVCGGLYASSQSPWEFQTLYSVLENS